MCDVVTEERFVHIGITFHFCSDYWETRFLFSSIHQPSRGIDVSECIALRVAIQTVASEWNAVQQFIKKTPQLSKTFSNVWNARLLLRTTCWSHRVCHKNSYVFIFSVMSVFGPIPSGGPWLASSFFLVFLRCVTYFWLEVSSSPQLHLHTSRCADSTETGCFETWKLFSCCIYKYNEFLAETSGRGNCSIYAVLRTSNGISILIVWQFFYV